MNPNFWFFLSYLYISWHFSIFAVWYPKVNFQNFYQAPLKQIRNSAHRSYVQCRLLIFPKKIDFFRVNKLHIVLFTDWQVLTTFRMALSFQLPPSPCRQLLRRQLQECCILQLFSLDEIESTHPLLHCLPSWMGHRQLCQEAAIGGMYGVVMWEEQSHSHQQDWLIQLWYGIPCYPKLTILVSICCNECVVQNGACNLKNNSSLIQPEWVALRMAPVGPPFTKWSLLCTLGNTDNGGIMFPTAFKMYSTVTNSPRSALVSDPTGLMPLLVTTFLEFCTVVQLVSSRFQMSLAENLYLSITSTRFL